MVLDPSYGLKTDLYKELGLKTLTERANRIRENKEFAKNVSLILGEIAQEKQDAKDTFKGDYNTIVIADGTPPYSEQLAADFYWRFHKDGYKNKQGTPYNCLFPFKIPCCTLTPIPSRSLRPVMSRPL